MLFNAALEERTDCYKKTGRWLTLYAQQKELTEWRQTDEEARQTPLAIQRWTLIRLSDAYSLFFRRRQLNKRSGFPRFRNKDRWRSFGFYAMSGIKFDGRRLRFGSFPGGLRVHLHRPLPKAANIRSCTFTKDVKGWYVCLHVKVLERVFLKTGAVVGLDLGLQTFAHLSNGQTISAPKIARKSAARLRRRQRALVRCGLKSKRRAKVRKVLASVHRKIFNTRSTWLHQQSKSIVAKYDLIAVEDLNVAGMGRHPKFSRSIHDASWSKFLGFLAYKAERAGKHLIRVDPRNTSQKCSGCGAIVPKTLAERTHSCPGCGLVLDRDHNAAINILNAAVLSRGEHNVIQWDERALGNLDQLSSQYPDDGTGLKAVYPP